MKQDLAALGDAVAGVWGGGLRVNGDVERLAVGGPALEVVVVVVAGDLYERPVGEVKDKNL